MAVGGSTLALTVASYFDAQANVPSARLVHSFRDKGMDDEVTSVGSVNSAAAFGTPRVALGNDPLDAFALAELAQNYNAASRPPIAANSFRLLGKVTRRSRTFLMTELADAAEGHDLARAVRALDRLASLEPSLRADVFSVLAEVLGKPDGAQYVAKLRGRRWFPAFIAAAARDASSVYQIAQFVLVHRLTDPDQREKALRTVLAGLLAQNAVGVAQEFAARFQQVQKADLNSLDWPTRKIYNEPLPLEWQFPNPAVAADNGVGTSMEFVFNGVPGPTSIAEKILTVSPGIYEISSQVRYSASRSAPLFWKIRCINLKTKPIEQSKVVRSQDSAIIATLFEATKACQGYIVSLSVSNPTGQYKRYGINVGRPNLNLLR